MTDLRFSENALRDIEDILVHLEAVGGRHVALKLGEKFRAAAAHISLFPSSGAQRHQFGPTMRMWAVLPYLIFYRYQTTLDAVSVVRILHGRRDIDRIFRRERS
jgi:plasmid stabilization system protein ParE